MLEKIAEGQATEGMEALIPALVDRLELLIDVLPSSTLILVNDPELVRTRAEDLVRTSQEFLHAGWAAAASGGRRAHRPGGQAYQQLADVRAHALERGQGWWSLSPFVPDPDAETGEHLNLVDIPSWHGDVQAFTAQIKQDVADGWRVLLSVEGPGQASRMAEVLRDNDIASGIVEDLDEVPEQSPVVHIFRSGMRKGWRAPRIGLVVHAAGDITGAITTAERAARKMPANGATRSSRWNSNPAIRWCISSTASDATSRWSPGRWPVPPAITWSSNTRRPNAASPATGCTCRWTSSTRSPATSAGRPRNSTRWAEPTGSIANPGLAGPSTRSHPA
jgi:transcription-repair coupling factor (superfamily II helicase)